LIAATNMPWTLDSAFLRRFQKKIHIPLPDKEARKRLFEINVGDTLCDISAKDYEEFARQTEEFSGSNIRNVVQEALMRSVTRIYEAKYFCHVCSLRWVL